MRRSACSLLTLLVWGACVHSTLGQFTTVYNIPPGPDLGDNTSIGSDTQVNLFAGGTIGSSFDSGSSSGTSTNIEINMFGGTIGSAMDAYNGTTFNISGGQLGISFDAFSGSTVNVSGGHIVRDFEAKNGSSLDVSGGFFESTTIGGSGSTVRITGGRLNGIRMASGNYSTLNGGSFGGMDVRGATVVMDAGQISSFDTQTGSSVEFHGGEFQLNGSSVSGAVDIGPGDILTGTLTDGSVFIFTTELGDNIANGTVTLRSATIPAEGGTTFNVPVDPAPNGLRAGQTLNLAAGGSIVSSFNSVDATINMTGGDIGRGMRALGTTMTISSGSLTGGFELLHNTTATVSGGTIGSGDVNNGALLNLNGGETGIINIRSGGVMNVAGGFVERLFAHTGGQLNVSGGIVGHNGNSAVRVRDSATMNVSGGAIGRGALFDFGSTFVMNGGSLGVGVRASSGSSLELRGGAFLLDGVAVSGPTNMTSGSILTGNLEDGTAFIFRHTQNNLDDRIDNGTLNLVNTSVAPVGPPVLNVPSDTAPLSIRSGQTLNISSGGRIEHSFAAIDSTFNMSGGELGYGAEFIDSLVNINGGDIDRRLTVYRNSTVNVRGGAFGNLTTISDDVEFNVFGEAFALNGVDITDTLTPNTPFLVTDRDVSLSGLFSDGTSFLFQLKSTQSFEADYFSTLAQVNLILVPEPGVVIFSLTGFAFLMGRRRVN